MAKMYYSEDEAAAKLKVNKDQLKEMVEQAKLRIYADGTRRLYKVDEVDRLVAPAGSGEVELTPAEPSLAEAKPASTGGKDDTVLTSEGISIFDDEDLEIEAGDPMAKTTIAPSVADQGSGEGSGSGLLDLTHESDDTSLGSEVLKHIDESGTPGSGVAHTAEIGAEPDGIVEAEAPAVIEMPTVVEEIDRSAGVFSGLIAAATIIMLVLGSVVLAVIAGLLPPYVVDMQKNMGVVMLVAVVLCLAFAVVGYFIGKATAAKAAALQRT
jgi:excisionase family DNA binding protein